MSDKNNKNTLLTRNTLSDNNSFFTVTDSKEVQGGFIYENKAIQLTKSLSPSPSDKEYDVLKTSYINDKALMVTNYFTSFPNNYPTQYFFNDSNGDKKQLYFAGPAMCIYYNYAPGKYAKSIDDYYNYFGIILDDLETVKTRNVSKSDIIQYAIGGNSPEDQKKPDFQGITVVNPQVLGVYYQEDFNDAAQGIYWRYPEIGSNMYELVNEPYFQNTWTFRTGFGEGTFRAGGVYSGAYSDMHYVGNDSEVWLIDYFEPPFPQPESGDKVWAYNKQLHKIIHDTNVSEYSATIYPTYRICPQKDGNDGDKKIKNFTLVYDAYNNEAYFDPITINNSGFVNYCLWTKDETKSEFTKSGSSKWTVDSILLYDATKKHFITYVYDYPIRGSTTYQKCVYSGYGSTTTISGNSLYYHSQKFSADTFFSENYYSLAFFGRVLPDTNKMPGAIVITDPDSAIYTYEYNGNNMYDVLNYSTCWGRFCMFPNSKMSSDNTGGAFRLADIPDFKSPTKYIASAKYVYNSSSEKGSWTDVVSFTPDNPSVYPVFGDLTHIHITNRNIVPVTLTLTKSTGEKLLDEFPLNINSDTGTIKLEAGYTYTATFTFGKIKNKKDPTKLLTTSARYYAGEDTSTNA